ncbi:hypothetical protein L5I01_15550 [Gordonia sp. HY442]|uniref:hypothetical protein n=1 Tax=Gordonia zhenghanii TaxID=2911516 RepID=UPI001F31B9C0|nr:hypothetical protein [Gordonia zhenghanii]MCF8604772.1 hypothetical protein [Gordonia zhenghanii]
MTIPDPGTPDVPTRPDSVRLAVELWCAVIVAQLIAAVAQYPVVLDQSRTVLKDMAEQQGQEMPASPTTMAVLSMILVCVILTAIALTFLKFFWDGRNWARQVLGVFSAFLAVELVFSVLAMFGDSESGDGVSAPAWSGVFSIIGGVAAIGVLVALMNKDTAGYCRDMAVWRDHKRQNGGVRG